MASGDKAGEHLTMERGEGSGWPFVVLGAAMFALVVTFIISGVLHVVIVDNVTAVDLGWPAALVSLAASGGVVAWVYLDRWYVNEAYTSRYGLGFIQLFYLPVLSIGYALSRCVERATEHVEK